MSSTEERIAKYREMLDAVDEAILKVLSGQSYSLGSRTVTRADLKQLRLYRKELEADIEALEENGTTRRRFKRIVPIG
ncbi:MAG: hypothetical protein IJ087_00170 [Eggerthellaceae bacterium]|nr:hypothetical protein [Eggerthellaceae bacterium]